MPEKHELTAWEHFAAKWRRWALIPSAHLLAKTTLASMQSRPFSLNAAALPQCRRCRRTGREFGPWITMAA